jgi:hypothetical protein
MGADEQDVKCGECVYFRPDNNNSSFGWCGHSERRVAHCEMWPDGIEPSVSSRCHSCHQGVMKTAQ